MKFYFFQQNRKLKDNLANFDLNLTSKDSGMKNKLIIIILMVAVGLSSCGKEKIEGKIKNDAKFAAELRSSAENIAIGNNNLILATYLWRDFMPIAEENGSKMICINMLTEVDSIPILGTIILKKQYLIRDNEIWTADYSEIKKNTVFITEGVVRDGPKWGPNIEVDVVCEFENSGTTYRILAKSQLIIKTS